MKYFNFILIFLFFGCLNPSKEYDIVGTWHKCNRDGSYWEYKITNQYLVSLNSNSEDVWVFRNKILDSSMVISNLDNAKQFVYANDTILIDFISKNKVLLTIYPYERIELNKASFIIEPIDSSDFNSWKNRVKKDFLKRIELSKCRQNKSISTIELEFNE